MPVSFPVAAHPAKPYEGQTGSTAAHALAAACPNVHTKVGEILQSSLGSGDEQVPNLVPNANGFVAAVLDAYTQDRALVIRPDDVWLAILSQFNFFVTARAELLRANFVAHDGKEELVLQVIARSRYDVDFGALAVQMTNLVEKNVVDPALRAWALPAFSTTTPTDTTAGAVLLMATLKKYFDYKILLMGCGIPRVTLDGERADWVEILTRLEKLREYGLETIAWYHLLRPVIARFVAAFDAPTSAANVDFWQRVAHYTPGGSGRGDYYTGWITAFTVFDKEGQWLGSALNEDAVPGADPASLTAAQFHAIYSRDPAEEHLVLDDAPFHRISGAGVPPAFGEVDVTLDDNGTLFACAMVGGLVGMRVSSSGDRALSAGGEDDTVRPAAGWWMFVKVGEGEMKERAREAFREKYRGHEPRGGWD
ncbi:hypothetical protein B0H15DRAFT_928532 [Mycena belliarum]|uniref:Uncharacterized protein n=1 Tax=Mycena belliarum TaxID=1033014 RepID=A0AAD6XW51_9AGAR|nr:hypothetical protein B0H15DRAFT_928532 [Mycena belliae]